MIGHLRGSLLAKQRYQIVLDVAGVGYQLRVPYSTSQLPAIGKELAQVRARRFIGHAAARPPWRGWGRRFPPKLPLSALLTTSTSGEKQARIHTDEHGHWSSFAI